MNRNKFLEKYPQLREPQIGDIIEKSDTIHSSYIQGKIVQIDKDEPRYLLNSTHDNGQQYRCWVFSENVRIIKIRDENK
jgi:hypothetical protein